MISLFFAVNYKRKLIEAIPVGAYLFMLIAYLLGITGHVSHVVSLFMLYELAGLVGTLYLAVKKKADISEPFKDIGNLIFIIMLVIIWILSLHMRVTNFDDFHSWAITPKDMYYVNGLPTGNMASTFYRDYFPLVYIMDFFAFKLTGGFKESTMFYVLWSLMLVSLAEMLHHREDDDVTRYVCRALCGVMLPFLVSFQFLHCLGTDILATTIFGSALVYIMEGRAIGRGAFGRINPVQDKDKAQDFQAAKQMDESFDYIRIVLAVTVLGMMKTTSLIFSMVCIGVYFVRNIEIKILSSWLRFVMLSAVTGGFWLSWKTFCKIKGNTTYLSDNLDRNLSGGHGGLPYYAGSTTKEFISKLFTYGLNDGTVGLTSVIILVVFIAAFIIYIKCSVKTGDISATASADERPLSGQRAFREWLTFAVVILGMIGYLLVMIYIYLFVFEEWEALSLSSYDRYISTYFGAMLYMALFLLFTVKLGYRWIAPVFTLVLAVTINYPYVAKTLIPSGYAREYGGTVAEIEAIEDEFMQAAGELPSYGESILVVDYTTDQLRAKVIPYAAVPGVTRLIRPDEETGSMPTEQDIADKAAEYNARVIDLR